MKTFGELPREYTECFTLDLQKDTKKMLLVNFLSLLIAIAMAVPMLFYIPLSTFFNEESYMMLLLKVFLFFTLAIIYIILHELIHGVAMKICGTKKISYGFTGIYAYTSSKDYYDRAAYIFIALAPIVTFLVTLAIVNVLVPLSWFWGIYFIQIINVSGAAGDIYVTCKFLRMPKDTLIQDEGVSMTVYTRQ